MMNVVKLTWKNMWHRKNITLLTMLTIAIASAFIVFIIVINDGIGKGAKEGFGPYELVIGADGSRTQLMLHTFYHIGAPTGNITYDLYEQLQASDSYEAAYPMTRGDSYKGFSLIGVPTEYLSTRYPEAVLTGDLYEETGEVVVGSHVAEAANLQVGDTFHANHGYIGDEHEHDELTFKVVGILPKLHTPDDKAMFTTLDYAWVVHDLDEEDHSTGDITSIVVVPKGIMELQELQQTFDQMDGVQATFSNKVISDILTFLDTSSALILILSIVCIIIATISVTLALTAVSAQRKKDIGLLRLLGKSKSFIMRTLLLEGVFLTLFGSVIGIVFGHVASYLVSSYVFSYAGITIFPWQFHLSELYILGGSIFIGCLAALFPSLQAYKVNPIVLFQSM